MKEKKIYCPQCNKIVRYCTDYVGSAKQMAKYCNICDTKIETVLEEVRKGPFIGSEGEFNGDDKISGK